MYQNGYVNCNGCVNKVRGTKYHNPYSTCSIGLSEETCNLIKRRRNKMKTKSAVKEEAKKILSKNLKAKRISMGLSQKALSKETCWIVHQRDISFYERGKNLPSMDRLKVLARALKTTPDELMGFAVCALDKKSRNAKKLNLFQRIFKLVGILKCA